MLYGVQGSFHPSVEYVRVQVTDGWYTCPALLHAPLTLQLLANNQRNLLQVTMTSIATRFNCIQGGTSLEKAVRLMALKLVCPLRRLAKEQRHVPNPTIDRVVYLTPACLSALPSISDVQVGCKLRVVGSELQCSRPGHPLETAASSCLQIR